MEQTSQMNTTWIIIITIFTVSHRACYDKEPARSCHRVINSCIKSDYKAVPINVSDYDDFQQLSDAIQSIVCNGSTPSINIKAKDLTIILSNPCWDEMGCTLIRSRNNFNIIDDQIHFDKSYPLDSLDVLIQRHYRNNGKVPFHAEHPQKILININYITKDFSQLEQLLMSLAAALDRVQSIDCFPIIFGMPPIPPPPPLPQSGLN